MGEMDVALCSGIWEGVFGDHCQGSWQNIVWAPQRYLSQIPRRLAVRWETAVERWIVSGIVVVLVL